MRNSKVENLNIAFFGTPEFAAVILEKLVNSPYKPSLVITQPDKQVGRKQILTPSLVKRLALKNNIEVMQPEKLDASVETRLKAESYQLFIVAAYGQIIPKKILEIPKYGTLNVHPSLLPRWRGPSPIQYAILNGDEETGVTIMLMDEEVDHGPVLAQRKFSIFLPTGGLPQGDNFQFSNGTGKPIYNELQSKLAEIGADLLLETIPKWINGGIKPKDQKHTKATYSKKIEKEDGRIDWSKSAEEIEKQIRAFTPWPGSFTFWDGKRLKIISGKIYNSSAQPQKNEMGRVLSDGAGIIVQTGLGVFVIDRLQIQGKREMSSKEFLNGYSTLIGSKLIY